MAEVLYGFTQVLQPQCLMFLVFGVFLGLIVGALPGLNDTITLAVLIPITFGMDPQHAMCLLVGVYVSACYGGSIPAILLKIPGTASAIITTLDGRPMAQRGEAPLALSISTCSSVFGGIFSSIVLLIFSPLLAALALTMGPPEYCMLALLGICSVVGMAKKGTMGKNMVSLMFGFLLASIGLSGQTGYNRFTFGIVNLTEGISLIPMLIGLFGVTSILELAESLHGVDNITEEVERVRCKLLDKKMAKRLLPTWLRCSTLGSIIGALPGAGMIMAIYMAYDTERKAHPNLDFGTGIPEGIAAPETANNAVVASSMVPLLALGIPGNATSALFLGALTIQGLAPGPTLYTNHPDIAYLLVVAFLVGNIFMLPMGLTFCSFLSRYIFKVRRELLSGLIILLCATGAFAVSNNIFNIKIIIAFGILGYFMNKFKIPVSPMILTVVLGPMVEKSFLQSMALSKGSLSIFFTRPMSAGLLLVSALFVIIPVVKMYFIDPKKERLSSEK